MVGAQRQKPTPSWRQPTTAMAAPKAKPQADGTTAIAERRAELLARTSYSTLNVSLLTLFSHGTWGKLRV